MVSRDVILGNFTLDLGRMLKQKNDAVNKLTSGVEYLFKKNGVAFYKGTAKIVGPNDVEVNEKDKKSLSAKTIVIATGSKPAEFMNVSVDEKSIVTSTGALEFEKVPESIGIIGGGIIGLELVFCQ